MALAYTIEAMVADKSFSILVKWIESHITVFNSEDGDVHETEENT